MPTPPSSPLDATALRYVAAIASAGRVPAAARLLGVAHTTLYRRVERLQGELQLKLFDRAADGLMTPTAAGRELVALAGEIDARVADVSRRLQAQHRQVAGEVSVAVSEPLARELSGWAAELRAAHPRLALHVVVSQRSVDLARGEADLAVRFARQPPPELVGQRVADAGFAVHGAAALAPGAVDLERQPWVVFDASLAATPQGRWEAASVPAERVALRTDSRAMFVEAIRAGVGVGVMPYALGDASIVPLGPPIDELALPVWVLAHRDALRSLRIRTVKQALIDRIQRERTRLAGQR